MIYNDPVSYARDKIISIGIDKMLLDLMFGGIDSNGVKKNIARELDKVLKEVCNDFNLISGDVMNIPLSKCKLLSKKDGLIYYVPPEVRRNVDIREVLSLRTRMPSPMLGNASLPNSGSMVINKMAEFSNALQDTYTDAVTFVELEDLNTVRITTNSAVVSTHDILVAEVENRDRLKKIKKGSYPEFYKIAVSYVKAVIYNNRLSLNKVAIYNGHEISDVTSAIGDFSGSSEEYASFLEDGVGKLLTFSDESKLNNIYYQMAKF